MGKSGDQRTRMTKQLIRKAFMELLREKPIHSISIRELCGLAGINRGTFYAHYKDIYDLLEQIEEEMTRDIERALEPLLSVENRELTPLKITTEIFRCLKENADLLEEWLREGMVTGAEEIAAMAEDMMMYGVGCLKK